MGCEAIEPPVLRVMDIEVCSYCLVGKGNGSYYTYSVRTTVSGRSYTVDKRYSDMLSLHKKLKKQMKNVPSFPPKQMRNHDYKVLDARKAALSRYFHEIAQSNLITKSLLDFLDVRHFPPSLAYDSNLTESIPEFRSLDYLDDVTEPNHAPIFMYRGDTLIHPEDMMDDIIVPGVLKAIYG